MRRLIVVMLCVCLGSSMVGCAGGPAEEPEDWSACPWAPDGYVYPDHERRTFVNIDGEAREDRSFLDSLFCGLLEAIFSGG